MATAESVKMIEGWLCGKPSSPRRLAVYSHATTPRSIARISASMVEVTASLSFFTMTMTAAFRLLCSSLSASPSEYPPSLTSTLIDKAVVQ